MQPLLYDNVMQSLDDIATEPKKHLVRSFEGLVDTWDMMLTMAGTYYFWKHVNDPSAVKATVGLLIALPSIFLPAFNKRDNEGYNRMGRNLYSSVAVTLEQNHYPILTQLFMLTSLGSDQKLHGQVSYKPNIGTIADET